MRSHILSLTVALCLTMPTWAAVTTSYEIDLWDGSAWTWGVASDSTTDGSRVAYDGRWAGYEPGQIGISGSTWDATAAVEADLAAGTFRTSASALTYVQRDSDVQNYQVAATSEIRVTDSLTFSKATTVTLQGRIHGNVAAQVSHSNNGAADASASISWFFENPQIYMEDRRFGDYSESWWSETLWGDDGAAAILPGQLPATPDIDMPFLVTVDVPAGTIDFTLEMESGAGARSYLWDDAQNANSDADSDFGNTVVFEMLVPSDVIVTSESGMFPSRTIPEPASLILFGCGALIMLRPRRTA